MQTPAAKRSVLVMIAGLVWSAVGLALISAALYWVVSSESSPLVSILIGTAGGIVIHRFGFSRVVRTNLVRIYELAPEKEKICVFAFQAWRSYPLVIVMMLMGYTLRHLPVPRLYLAAVYLVIGLGLLLSSSLYYQRLR